jgi:uncharacterized membrane protein HdeD (DUF308 family)
MKKIEYYLIIGQLSLVFGIFGYLLNYLFLENNLILILFVGILFGISFVMNLTYLLKRRNK